MRTLLLVLVLCVLAGGAGFYAYRHFAPQGSGGELVGKPLPAGIALSDLDGHPHSFDEYRGKLLLINFWATWCAPCLHEIPDLVKLQAKYGAHGLQIVGPAVDDPDAVRPMLGSLGIGYPVLVSKEPEDMIKVMDQFGNGAGVLPYSILVGTDGRIVKQQMGPFTAAELESLVQGRLPS